MGEIKSTLDIVMEKTKHLSMTAEEKQAGKIEEIESALKGLVQKYQDRVLKPEQYRGEMMVAVQAGIKEKKDELRDKYLISGSAVIPNTGADPSVQRMVDDIKNRFQSALDKVKPYP